MKYAIMFVLAMALAACGDQYTAPPEANARKIDNSGGDTGGGTKKQPTGPSRTAAFIAESGKAHASWKLFGRDKSARNYAECGSHIFKALTARIEHERNGHDTGTLKGLRELNQLRTDWAKSEGQLTSEEKEEYKNDADYKAAFEEYTKLQQETD